MVDSDSDEAQSYLLAEEDEEASDNRLSDEDHGRVRRLLYSSHFLSTWNSRVFEFGAFLFLANIYTDTLLPASVYALSRACSAAALSPVLGSYMDQADRLKVVRISIVGQRLAVAVSCIGLFLMAQYEEWRTYHATSIGFLLVLSGLACIEKLCSVLNTMSIERDWIVTVAEGHEERLALLNSQMRRIDLFCKLIGPLAIAFVDSASPIAAIIATGAMTVVSVFVEYFTIANVYRVVPALQEPKSLVLGQGNSRPGLVAMIKDYASKTAMYVRHPAFLPSFSLALLHLTVLSFSGQMITYLVALGLSSGLIGALRGGSALIEISATWMAPKIMTKIGPVRAGIWFLNWEISCLVVACAFFWWDHSPGITAIGTVGAVIASRLGLWGFDLSAQIIVQEEVEQQDRGTFSSQEFALQNIFEMLAFASTIVFPRPSQFKFPATISAIAVGLSGVLFAMFVRSRRGHLIHLCRCIDRHEMKKDHHHWWQRVPDDDEEESDVQPSPRFSGTDRS